MSETVKRRLAPLRKNVEVTWPPETAFRRFTAEMATWWPLRSHSVAGERARSVVFESHVGGRIYEIADDGSTCTWGTVLAWEPPDRVEFTFHPGRGEDVAQNVEVRFVRVGTGTRLELTHTGWERLGRKARLARPGFNVGWSYVLDLWAARHGALVMFVRGLERLYRMALRIRQQFASRDESNPARAAPR
jgi:hypothetical protein